VSHPSGASIGADTTALKRRAAELSATNMDAATNIALLAAQIGGDNAHDYLEGYINQENWPEDMIKSLPTTLVPLILERHPRLVASPCLWARSDHMGVLSKFISRMNEDRELLINSIKAIIKAKSWDALSVIIDQIGPFALTAVCTVLDSIHSKRIDYPQAFYNIISAHLQDLGELIASGVIGPRSLRILSAEIDPRSWYIRRSSVRPWLDAATLDTAFVDRKRATKSSVFFLTIGLRDGYNRDAIELVASEFSPVYVAAKDNILDDDIWERVEPCLSWYNPNWDRCARLIRTVAKAFKEKSWPLELFSMTFESSEQFERALSELNDSRSGHRFVMRLQHAQLEGLMQCSSEQSMILKGF